MGVGTSSSSFTSGNMDGIAADLSCFFFRLRLTSGTSLEVKAWKVIGDSRVGVVGERLADEVGEKACCWCLLKREKDILMEFSERTGSAFSLNQYGRKVTSLFGDCQQYWQESKSKEMEQSRVNG